MDGVNSMTGNAPDLNDFARLARRYDAMLYVDDAHGFGVIGERSPAEASPYGIRGNSVVRYCDESYDRIVLVGGFSKSYSSLAAFVACPTELKELLKTAAPPYLYSGPSPVASLATVLAGFDVNETRGDAIRADLWHKTDQVLQCLDRLGVHTPNRSGFPIIEVPLARHDDIDAAGRFLFDNGVYVTLAAYPLVPEDRGRVPDPGHRRQLAGRDRASRRRARQARELVRSAACATTRIRGVSRLSGVDWRGRAWAVYLAVCGALTVAYLWLPPLKASGPLINLLGLSSSLAIAVGIYLHRPKACGGVDALHRRPVPVLRRRPLHVQLSEALRCRSRVPVARRRHLPDRLSGAGRGPARSREAAQPARRPRRRDRLAHPHGRHRAALLGLPRCAEHPPVGAHPAREGRVRRLPPRRHPASGRRDSPCGRHGEARARLLSPRREHRLAARRRLCLHLRAAHGCLRSPAELRRRLDRLLPAMGRGRAPPLDAYARGAGARLADAAHSASARPSRRCMPDRARHPRLAIVRRHRQARADLGFGRALPARGHAHGGPRAPGGAGGLARTVAQGSRGRSRRRRGSRAGS